MLSYMYFQPGQAIVSTEHVLRLCIRIKAVSCACTCDTMAGSILVQDNTYGTANGAGKIPGITCIINIGIPPSPKRDTDLLIWATRKASDKANVVSCHVCIIFLPLFSVTAVVVARDHQDVRRIERM